MTVQYRDLVLPANMGAYLAAIGQKKGDPSLLGIEGIRQEILSYLPIHEAAKTAELSKSQKDATHKVLNGKAFREKLQVPPGITTVEYLKKHGAPSVEIALQRMRAEIATQQSLDEQTYIIDMPLDPGCSVVADIYRPLIHRSLPAPERDYNLSLPRKLVVTSRSKLPRQENFYSLEDGRSNLKRFINGVRKIAGLNPMELTLEGLYREIMGQEFSYLYSIGNQGVFVKSIFSPIAMIPEEVLHQLENLKGSATSLLDEPDFGEMLIRIIPDLKDHMSPENHALLTGYLGFLENLVSSSRESSKERIDRILNPVNVDVDDFDGGQVGIDGLINAPENIADAVNDPVPLDDHPLNVVPNNVDRPLDSLNRFLDRNLDPILRSVERNLRPIGRIVQNSLPHVNRALRPVGRLLDRILLLSWILMDPIVEFILARPRNLVLYISLVMVLLSIFR